MGDGELQSLMSVGVKVDEGNLENFLDEGKSLVNHLKIDDALLDSKLLNNFDEVRRIFAFEARISNTRFFVTSHSDQISFMVAGKNFLTTLLRTGDEYSMNFTLDGQSYAGTVQEIEGNFRILGNVGTPFEGIVMAYTGQAINDGSSVSSNILMTQGIADRLNTYLNSALMPVKGAFAVEKEDLKSEQENLKDQLLNLTERFEREKEAIIYRFSRLQSSLVALEAFMRNITTYMGTIASNK